MVFIPHYITIYNRKIFNYFFLTFNRTKSVNIMGKANLKIPTKYKHI